MEKTEEKIIVNNRSFRPRLPEFLKQRIPKGDAFTEVQRNILTHKLNTVCEEAKCPNRTHCYARGTLTFQILGNVCTRSCGFCAETFGKPSLPLDPNEPAKLIDAAKNLQLKHVVITSPARDDLNDDGSQAFADVIAAFKRELPHVTVEVLTPDFQGKEDCLKTVFDSKPDIFNHNIETVRRLTPKVRSKATYDRTLFVLKKAKEASMIVKSGIMVGHGETKEEILQTFEDLAKIGCEMLTIGQYLPPSPNHLPLEKIYLPKEFDELRQEALKWGFLNVASGPLVRSSYQADQAAATVAKFKETA